jgi:hypothetical protein
VLGAYPSALHIRWQALSGQEIRALPVDDEPEPFWTGSHERERIHAWKSAIGFDPAVHGTVGPVGQLNGSSGRALDTDYLEPLGISREDAWITDCLPTYHSSDAVAKAIAERFLPALPDGTPPPKLPPHPSEATIISNATDARRLEELGVEFEQADPEIVITLGNAAARVFATMLGISAAPRALTVDGYGSTTTVPDEWIWWPLAHPGAVRAIPAWTSAHTAWKRRVASQGRTRA